MKHILIIALLLASLVFTSNANAQFWQQTNGPGGTDIKSVAVNSQGHIFVLSNSLMRSTDDGNSWMGIGTENPIYNFSNLYSKSTGQLFAITSNLNLHDSNSGLWRSIDEGITWTKLISPSPARIDFLPDGRIFLIPTFTVLNHKYLTSSNNGDSWVQDSTNTIDGPFEFFGDKAGHLFFSASNGSNFYRSIDNGQNWSKIVNGIQSVVDCFAEAPNGDLYAGSESYNFDNKLIVKSTDGGRVWSADSINLPKDYSEYCKNIFVTTQGRIVASLDKSKIVSDDNGKNWRRYSNAPNFHPNPTPGPIGAMDNNGVFYLNYAWTLFRSNLDQGSIWTHIDAPTGSVSGVLKYPNGNLMANDWVSSDEGKHWTININGGVYSANAIDSSGNILTSYGGNITRSQDSGKTWKTNSGVLTQSLITAIEVRHKGEIFASSSNEGVFRSIDNGVTWDQINIGIKNQNIFSLAVHQNGDVYAGSQNIIYKSTDVGLTWNTLTTNFPAKAGNVTAMVVNTQGNIIAGVDNAGVFWSTDNGVTWTQKALGLTATKINALVSTPSGKVFAGTDSGIFFLDITPGANWLKFNQGLTATNVLSLCRDQSGRIYAGTDVSGVFSSINTFNIAHPNGSVAATTLVAPTNASTAPAGNLKLVWNAVPKATTYQVSISKTSDFSTVEILSDYLSDTTFSYNVHDVGVTYYWHVQAVGDEGGSLYSDDWSFITSSKAGVNNSNPFTTSLGTNYPNPFSTSTIIPFTIGERSFVKLEILDPLGKTCSILANGNYNPGNYEVKYNGENLSAGTYFIRLQTEKQSFTKILEIVK